jgi:hypothetical protein
MSLVATYPMSERADSAGQTEYCTYVPCKIDPEVLRFAKGAAAVEGKDVQDWLSDIANVAAAKILNRKPIKRRPNRPRGHAD